MVDYGFRTERCFTSDDEIYSGNTICPNLHIQFVRLIRKLRNRFKDTISFRISTSGLPEDDASESNDSSETGYNYLPR